MLESDFFSKFIRSVKVEKDGLVTQKSLNGFLYYLR